ncbi:hypothetical protein [Rhizobium lentis]|nr:hypothetical protein [Rhizobium lentis]
MPLHTNPDGFEFAKRLECDDDKRGLKKLVKLASRKKGRSA